MWNMITHCVSRQEVQSCGVKKDMTWLFWSEMLTFHDVHDMNMMWTQPTGYPMTLVMTVDSKSVHSNCQNLQSDLLTTSQFTG